MTNYEDLLERGYKTLPESTVVESERFEIPKVRGHLEGNKTIITNFTQMASTFRRPVEHLLKFILKELAAPGDLKGNLLIIGSKIPASRINEKIIKYAEEYVICKECGKPDTKLVKEDEQLFKRCQACGAKQPVQSKI
ncbi:MAG: translation initiation factor IF-2 subunit beta [Nanoarchaeota archaeon]|nr:translation initiation factor IF-2 subunit beta [Nanoarchaeota archaeon]